MDMIWDQDVRVTLAAIIGREKEDETDEKVSKNIQLAIRYANKLGEARAVLERRPPVIQHRPNASRGYR
jgi:hypothetical protein